MADKSMPITGGCHCGAVRFEVTSEPIETYCCHCRICQRTSGSAFLAGAVVAAKDFIFTKGEPVGYQTSPHLIRLYCPTCHTQLGSRQPGETKLMDVHLTLFDDQETFQPDFHQFTSSQVGWLKLADDLSRHAEEAPDLSSLWKDLES